MKKLALAVVLLSVFVGKAFCADDPKEGANTLQSFSGKVGYYAPSGGLNNGLILGADGITEFLHYNFFLSVDLDLYYKKSIGIFDSPQPGGAAGPDVTDQRIIVMPLHANIAYQLLDVADADTRVYLGAGGGYVFYFYSVDYQGSSGGLLGGPLTAQSATSNGGSGFASVFVRALVGKVFVEPRYYWASPQHFSIGGYSLTVNPSGFAVTLGFQYH